MQMTNLSLVHAVWLPTIPRSIAMNLAVCPLSRNDTDTRFSRDSLKLVLVRVARLVLPSPISVFSEDACNVGVRSLSPPPRPLAWRPRPSQKLVSLVEVEHPAAPNLGLFEVRNPLVALGEGNQREAAGAPIKEFGESETLEGNALQRHGRTFAEHGVDVFANDVVARVGDLFANAE